MNEDSGVIKVLLYLAASILPVILCIYGATEGTRRHHSRSRRARESRLAAREVLRRAAGRPDSTQPRRIGNLVSAYSMRDHPLFDQELDG